MSEAGSPVEVLSTRRPIEDRGRSMSYLGVEIKKAENPGGPSHLVPDKSLFTNIINTKTAIEMQHAMALALATGTPLHVEGGTDLGKSRIPRKMASDLDAEFYSMTCNGYTNMSDFLGRFVPNPAKHGPDDPAYVYEPGIISQGLTPDEGKLKIVVVNEINSASADGVKGLNEVLDAYTSGDPIPIKAPDGTTHYIQIDPRKTLLVITSNRKGQGYKGIGSLSKDFSRRFPTHAMPEELPADDYRFLVRARSRKDAPKMQAMPEDAFLDSNELPLSLDELMDLPGYADAMDQYAEFHLGLREAFAAGDLDRNPDGNEIVFGDHTEFNRIENFMALFCKPGVEPLSVLKKALTFYYANKLTGHNKEQVTKRIDALSRGEINFDHDIRDEFEL